ncbi:MAG: hypothetical protein AAGJ82_01620, partial [Bacteroidota bacterium]
QADGTIIYSFASLNPPLVSRRDSDSSLNNSSYNWGGAAEIVYRLFYCRDKPVSLGLASHYFFGAKDFASGHKFRGTTTISLSVGL